VVGKRRIDRARLLPPHPHPHPPHTCPGVTGVALSTQNLTSVPDDSASISFISFIASMMQIVCPLTTTSPSFENAGSPGAGDR